MPYPHEGIEAAVRNSVGDVREFLDTKHRDLYKILNFAEKAYDAEKFHNNVR